jgi:hypothetical protein
VTRRLTRLIAGLALVGALACAPQPQQAGSNDQANAEGRSTGPAEQQASTAPTRKAILEALLANLEVPLSVHPSCMGVGTEADDQTIGDYVSGFLAEFERGESRNWIDTTVDSAASVSGEPVWRADVMLHHAAGDDEWGWGVRFDFRKADGRIVRESFQCVGAG